MDGLTCPRFGFSESDDGAKMLPCSRGGGRWAPRRSAPGAERATPHPTRLLPAPRPAHAGSRPRGDRPVLLAGARRRLAQRDPPAAAEGPRGRHRAAHHNPATADRARGRGWTSPRSPAAIRTGSSNTWASSVGTGKSFVRATLWRRGDTTAPIASIGAPVLLPDSRGRIAPFLRAAARTRTTVSVTGLFNGDIARIGYAFPAPGGRRPTSRTPNPHCRRDDLPPPNKTKPSRICASRSISAPARRLTRCC